MEKKFMFLSVILITSILLSHSICVFAAVSEEEAGEAIKDAEEAWDEERENLDTIKSHSTWILNVEEAERKIKDSLNMIEEAKSKYDEGKYEEALNLANNAVELARAATQGEVGKSKVTELWWRIPVLVGFVLALTVVVIVAALRYRKKETIKLADI